MKLFIYRIIIAIALSIIWVSSAHNEYGYNYNFPKIYSLNLFPLLFWPLGLIAMYIVYAYFTRFIKKPNFKKNLLLFITLYWPLLILAEYIGYYFFNVHNLATSMYSGLPICHCMHAPAWMQFMYFAMGPVFLLICYTFKLESKTEKIVDK